MPSLPAYHQQPHDRGTAGMEVLPLPNKRDVRRRVTSTAPVTSVHWVTFRRDTDRYHPGAFHIVNHSVFDGLLQLKYVTWCDRVQHAAQLVPSGGDYPRIDPLDQCQACVTEVRRFVDNADAALRGR